MDSVVVDECLWWKTAAAIITTIAVNDGCEFVGLSVCLRLPRRRRSQPRDLACELAVGCTCQCKRNGCAHDGANTIEVRRKVELSSAHHASFIFACHRPSTRTLLCSRSTTLPRSCADPEQCTVPWHAERQRWGIEECLSIITSRPKAVVLRLFRLLCYSCHLNRFLCQPQRPSYRSPSQALQQLGLT